MPACTPGTRPRRHRGVSAGRPVDLLTTSADLERWIVACDELPDDVTAADATFEAALSLREALYHLGLDCVHDRPFHRASLEIVNDAAADPTPTLTLTDTGPRRSGDIGSVLSHLARRGIAVLADPDNRPKECARAGCTRLYVDRSRGAAYRARRRASSRGPGETS